MEVAPCYTLLTLFTLFKLLSSLLEWIDELLSKKWDGVYGVKTVMTIKAPVVLKCF